ncbi:MAG: hypothetical protein U1E02_18660, partial [Hydrogenophaga sp.]|nr:hypothetical protein [Hydrogenophaga sp.]
MCNKNWLIVFLVLLGAGLVILKNREKTAPIAPQETTEQTAPEQSPGAEQTTTPTEEQTIAATQEITPEESAPEMAPTTQPVVSEAPAVTSKKQPTESKITASEKEMSTGSDQSPAVKTTTPEPSAPAR